MLLIHLFQDQGQKDSKRCLNHTLEVIQNNVLEIWRELSL